MIDILDEVKDCRTIAVSGHIRPDGDAAGACVGMALYLEKAMPHACVDVFLEDLSDALRRNLPGSGRIHYENDSEIDRYDAFICLDCECGRLGWAFDIFKKAGKTINIDHHGTNPGTGDVCYVVPKASSACELVYNTMRKEWINREIAQNLYVGMMTDTGIFSYSNTGRRTMEIAGDLISYGFDFPSVVQEVFREKTFLHQQMTGRALVESFLVLDGRCIVSRIERKTMQFFHATSKDMDGIVSVLVQTRGVECAIFMYGIREGGYKVSLRSNGKVDVSRIAQIYGGGGHARASGCTVNAAFRDIVDTMTPLIGEQLRLGVRV